MPRTKHLSGEAAISAMRNGSDFSGAIYSLDTGNCVFPPAFAEGGGFGIPEITGFPDISIVPDPTTFRILPWADRTGWMLCDAYFSNGKPMPLDGRAQLRGQLARLAERRLPLLLRPRGRVLRDALRRRGPDRPRRDRPARPGARRRRRRARLPVPLRQRASTAPAHSSRPLRDGLWDVGLPPRSIEDEWGPGQFEFTFSPMEGLDAADAMILFRSTMKAVCARRGLLASFMCWPQLPNFFPSGWHLHQSLVDAPSGTNAFVDDREVLSPVGLQFVAGLLDHAQGDDGVRRPDDQRVRRASARTRSRPTGSAGPSTTAAR